MALVMVLGLSLLSACTCGEKEAPKADPKPPAVLEAANPDGDADAPDNAIAPPPVDPIARDEWLKEVANQMPEPVAGLQMGPEGVGVFKACIDEDELRSQRGIRLCPDTAITAEERCYTTYLTSTRDELPLELWVRGGLLFKAISRSKRFVSPQSVGVGESLVRLTGLYKGIRFLRGDEGEWIAAVEPLGTQFVLDNKTAKTVDEMDPTTPIVRMETIFDCRAGKPKP
jgi:hypothetical protein